jgi:hypothetical protein
VTLANELRDQRLADRSARSRDENLHIYPFDALPGISFSSFTDASCGSQVPESEDAEGVPPFQASPAPLRYRMEMEAAMR